MGEENVGVGFDFGGTATAQIVGNRHVVADIVGEGKILVERKNRTDKVATFEAFLFLESGGAIGHVEAFEEVVVG